MMTRLHTKYPALSEKILASPHEVRERIVRAAAHLAIENSGLEPSLAATVRAAVDGKTHLEASVREKLEQLRTEMDNKYLDVLDTLAANEVLPDDAATKFHQARALAAVLEAVEPVDAKGATEATYEAILSSRDEDAAAETISNAGWWR